MSNREIDLSKPSLSGLSYLLRNNAIWPIGFKWDFSTTETCALGLASEYWDVPLHGGREFAKQHFGMGQADALNIFYGKGDWAPKLKVHTLARLFLGDAVVCSNVSPDMVADAIDDYVLCHTVGCPQPQMTNAYA